MLLLEYNCSRSQTGAAGYWLPPTESQCYLDEASQLLTTYFTDKSCVYVHALHSFLQGVKQEAADRRALTDTATQIYAAKRLNEWRSMRDCEEHSSAALTCLRWYRQTAIFYAQLSQYEQHQQHFRDFYVAALAKLAEAALNFRSMSCVQFYSSSAVVYLVEFAAHELANAADYYQQGIARRGEFVFLLQACRLCIILGLDEHAAVIAQRMCEVRQACTFMSDEDGKNAQRMLTLATAQPRLPPITNKYPALLDSPHVMAFTSRLDSCNLSVDNQLHRQQSQQQQRYDDDFVSLRGDLLRGSQIRSKSEEISW